MSRSLGYSYCLFFSSCSFSRMSVPAQKPGPLGRNPKSYNLFSNGPRLGSLFHHTTCSEGISKRANPRWTAATGRGTHFKRALAPVRQDRLLSLLRLETQHLLFSLPVEALQPGVQLGVLDTLDDVFRALNLNGGTFVRPERLSRGPSGVIFFPCRGVLLLPRRRARVDIIQVDAAGSSARSS